MPEIFLTPLVLPYFGFVLGTVLGSFLNVCAHRIPIGKSIILPSSHCPGCGATIPWFRNIPIITWLYQKGQAGCCAFSIPLRYWLIEVSVGLVFAYFAYLYSLDLDLVSLLARLLFSWIMIVVIVIDYETMLIPDRFSVGGAVFGVLFCFTFPELNEMAFDQTWLSHFASGFNSLLGLLIGSSLLYWIGTLAHIGFGREALGEGDVKLLGCIGAFCGWKGAIFAIFGGAFLGTLLLLPLMIFQKSFSKSTENENSDKSLQWGAEVPFGPYLAIGGIVYLGGASEVIDSWFDPILWFFDNTSLLKAF